MEQHPCGTAKFCLERFVPEMAHNRIAGLYVRHYGRYFCGVCLVSHLQPFWDGRWGLGQSIPSVVLQSHVYRESEEEEDHGDEYDAWGRQTRHRGEIWPPLFEKSEGKDANKSAQLSGK